MKKLLTASILVAMIMLSGCLSALYPLFTEKEIVFDPKLLGAWKGDSEGEIYTFQQGTPELFKELPADLRKLSTKAYFLTVSDTKYDEDAQRYYVFLARIGKHLYLDYYPAFVESQQEYATIYRKSFVRMHSFYRLNPESNRDSMSMVRFAEGYLKDLINKKQIRIRHEKRIDGSYVITAPTEELQQYVLKYGDVNDAYTDKQTFNRIK
ncbi:hypothetical protein [Paraflavitalea sp. CAU 1676]|uniref:hypothetical protein n=1 Tax=Paraflavitalea sp. CAU 1676 TaxID=3032598 RepID=UPI0023DCCAD1|nr:hypothetical protein [Paraflavitalea sp. CAU 1676]MDF2190801.1 hypothetical protein [Paraflavitalea sp. CAU 1676]